MAPSYDIATRAQALTLKINGFKNAQITEQTGISARGLQDLLRRAKERGFNPEVSMVIKNEYVIDAPRSGRPRKDAEKASGADEHDASLQSYFAGTGPSQVIPSSISPSSVQHFRQGEVLDAGVTRDGQIVGMRTLPYPEQHHHHHDSHVDGGMSNAMPHSSHPSTIRESEGLAHHPSKHDNNDEGMLSPPATRRMETSSTIDPSLHR